MILGYLEKVTFPEWGIKSVVAKVDTGALTSAIHVENIVPLDHDRIRFDVILKLSKPHKSVTVECDVLQQRMIRSSMGKAQNRYVVETICEIAGMQKKIQLSLVSRKKMSRRMLLGRRALARDFLVDASKRFLS